MIDFHLIFSYPGHHNKNALCFPFHSHKIISIVVSVSVFKVGEEKKKKVETFIYTLPSLNNQKMANICLISSLANSLFFYAGTYGLFQTS